MPALVWRALAVVGLAALAGLAALVVLSDQPNKYEAESSFAIRPSETVAPAALPDVVATLSQPDSAVTETIVDILGSSRLRRSAALAADLPPSSVAESGAEYSWTASRRTGSTIVDLTITGPSEPRLVVMQAAAAKKAARLVEDNYSVFRLESLSGRTPPEQAGAKTGQLVILAVLLGGIIGVALVFAERKLRSMLNAPPLKGGGGDGRPNGSDDLAGKTDQLESALQESLGTGASVRRVAPGRIEVAPSEPAPDRETARRRRAR